MSKEAFFAKNDYKTPLLFPVRFDQTHYRIDVLDETLLPFQEKYIQVQSLADAEKVLYEMKTRAFGQVLLFLYTVILETRAAPAQAPETVIDSVAQRFKEKRPTFDFPSIAGLLKKALAKTPGVSVSACAENFIKGFDLGRKTRASALAEKLPAESSILTLCNLNGELVYLYYALRTLDKKACFFVSETRPYLQGTRLTFWELSKEKIPCALLCDNQAANLMRRAPSIC